MKKICMAMGYLALMSTSAFSLTFTISDDVKEPATVDVTERRYQSFHVDLRESEGGQLYNPKKETEKVIANWIVGAKTVYCNTPSSPIRQDKPLDEQYSEIKLIKNPDYYCLKIRKK